MRIQLIGGFVALGVVTICPLSLRADDSTLFSRIDANADGQITASEIETQGKALYERLLRTSDKNKDGKLSKEEFEEGTKASNQKFEMSTSAISPGGLPGGLPSGKPGEMLANLQQMLGNIDRDKNGKISESEAPPRLKQNFKEFDKDANGELDRREIGEAMKAMRPGAGGSSKSEQPKKKKKA